MLLLHKIISSPRFDAGKHMRHMWVDRLNREYPADIGALLPLLLHVAELKPGDALFIPAGVLHTYLSGAGVELMTNSDNVMRGGLTPKHIDVTELIHILDFSPRPLNIIRPQAGDTGEENYPAPADEFRLSHIALVRNQIYLKNDLTSVEILFCVSGQAQLASINASRSLGIRQGEAALITAQAGAYQLQGEGEFYLAGVP